MPFQSLQTVLGELKHEYQRQEQSQMQQLMQCWAEVVGPVVAAQTRPLTFYRGVLKVATSSAVWAQNLVFERQRILEKLKQVSALPITDIRFSPGQWQDKPPPMLPGEVLQQELWRSHPSRLSASSVRRATPSSYTTPSASMAASPTPSHDVLAAFHQWSATMKLRSRQLPLCPECQCPAPVGELHRWTVCGICVTKRWAIGGAATSANEDVTDRK